MKKILRIILMVLMLMGGIGVLLYPDILDWYESRRHIGFIQEYNASIALMEAAEIEYELERARIFNTSITDIQINDPWGAGPNDMFGTEEYYSMLNFGENSMMARIEIPAINVDLPIFHSSTPAVLNRGVGHMPHTSLPIGGYGNHSLLTAHTGLVNARLFTNLVDLPLGDVFVITIANERLLYQVVDRSIVYPHQIEGLQLEANRDLITLVTCYPYGVNSHRLLVLGERIAYDSEIIEEIEVVINPLNIRHLGVISILVLLPTVAIIKWFLAFRRKQRKQKRLAAQNEQNVGGFNG